MEGFVGSVLPLSASLFLHGRVPTTWGQIAEGGKASKHLLSIRPAGERSTECSPGQDDGQRLSRPGETCSFSDWG